MEKTIGLKCIVFRALPKELEEEVNKFLESTPGTIHSVTQSESGDHLSLVILYEPDPRIDAEL